jgi:hypothetical protein
MNFAAGTGHQMAGGYGMADVALWKTSGRIHGISILL